MDTTPDQVTPSLSETNPATLLPQQEASSFAPAVAAGSGGRGKAKARLRKTKAITSSLRAGLVLPVGRLKRYLRQQQAAPRVSMGAAVYLTAVLEYLIAEVLEIAGERAKEQGRKRIIPRHILLAIKNDQELEQLFKSATFAAGGVVPHMHSALLPPASKSKKQNQDATKEGADSIRKKKQSTKKKQSAKKEKPEGGVAKKSSTGSSKKKEKAPSSSKTSKKKEKVKKQTVMDSPQPHASLMADAATSTA